MRRKRNLTSSERWELGLFMTMMIVGCLCFAVLLNLKSIPRLFAVFSTNSNSPVFAPILPKSDVFPAVSAPTQTTNNSLNLMPQAFPVGDSFVNNLLPTKPALPQSRFSVVHPEPELRTFNGHKYRLSKVMRLRVTAYAPDIRCTWPYPGTTTASGLSVKTNRGHLVAADTQIIPMHAVVAVPGYGDGNPVPVLDRGGAIKGPAAGFTDADV